MRRSAAWLWSARTAASAAASTPTATGMPRTACSARETNHRSQRDGTERPLARATKKRSGSPPPGRNSVVSHSPATDSRPQVDVLALIDHFAVGGAETLLTRFAEVAPRAAIRLSIACLEERDGNPAAQPLRERGVP